MTMNQRVASGEGRVAQNGRPARSPDRDRIEDAVRTARAEVAARGFIVRYSLGCLAAGRKAEWAGFHVDWAGMAATLVPALEQAGPPLALLQTALSTQQKDIAQENPDYES